MEQSPIFKRAIFANRLPAGTKEKVLARVNLQKDQLEAYIRERMPSASASVALEVQK